ncbi:MAG: prolipoprotein diacylglyceryl transferase [Bacilli bacterium]|nr:prolipoprotein diacylglyceryl transferase [Bacilli bacterium]
MYPDELFNIFGISIDMYATCFIVGVIACLIFTIIAMKKSGYSASASDTIIIIGILAIILGLLFAVLFQSFYDFIANPSNGFKITGRMTFLGGLLGGVISFLGLYFLYVYAINPRLKKTDFFKSDMNKGVWYLVRIAPISITIAHGFGRIGCLFAGCCHGHVTTEWYGIWNAEIGAKTVPIPLYEAIFLFVLSAVMILLLFKFHMKDNMAIYLVSYGIWRFVIEYFRDDYRGGFIPGISPSQFWSIIMVIGGIALFFIYRYFDNKIENKQKEVPVE